MILINNILFDIKFINNLQKKKISFEKNKLILKYNKFFLKKSIL